ncbi:Membrane protein involved in the export of O-antigen and teichoic acid [Pseudobutyrivibrio sp. UC1225]|uniref:lipopolysaccharide biosynthesis protein n=1 Tax=Pseudobutyrivibrio sp. UC1225 TaxID=1798185 RepID=UPI0008EF05B2|nr:polysaccharide biosynthesis C-terminal domain-containing protein [Pseudobutyrivibrio sp. UC1225]SFO26534.1 Membrane protein involved in the export of O-antigen and teichoic acid [Pseudobutyrivibrio sp. UC1225]
MGLNSETRTKSAGKNAVTAITNKIALLVLTFVSRKLFIKYIGIEYLGINGLFSNVLTLLCMADLGIGIAMNVSLYKPIAENDYRKISGLLNYFKYIYRMIALAVTVIGLGLIPFLKYLVNMDSTIPHLYIYYMVFVFKNTVSYLLVYKSSLLRADQKTYMINRLEIVVNFSKIVLQLLVVWLLKSYLCFILLDVLAIAAQNIIISALTDKQYKFIDKTVRLEKEEKKNLFGDISSVFLYKIAWSLLNGTDNILMSVIVGTIYVGLYSNYFTITNTLETLIALLFNSLTASIGNLVATTGSEKRYSTFKSMQMVSFWICGNVAVCILFLVQDFIGIWVGAQYRLDNLTVIAIVLNIFFSTCMRPVWTFREGTGMYKQIRYIMFVTALLNLILSIVLGKWLGISGILFATSISKISTYFWYEPQILFKKVFNVSPKNYFLEYLFNTLILAVCICLCFIPMKYMDGSNIVFWIIKALVCVIIVNIVYLVRYWKTDEFKLLKTKILSLKK